MKLVFFLASLLAVVQAQSSISLPAKGTVFQPGQNVTVQFVVTPADVGQRELSLVIGIVDCPGGACPDPSQDLGQILLNGIFKSQGTLGNNTFQTFDNITVIIPKDISGPASIQIQHNFAVTPPDHAAPAVEYLSTAIQVGNSPPPPPTSAGPTPTSGGPTPTSGGPTSTPTPTSTFNLHPNGNNAKCVGIKGGVYADGTPVDIFDCDQSVTQKWQKIGNALTSVNPVDGSSFCLDAGEPNLWAPGVPMKIWQCFSNLVQQTWAFQTNNNIQLTTANLCLDLTNGVLTNQNVLQIWTCGGGNPNQVWTQTPA